MWPWQHAAIGYLAYSLYCRWDGRRPDGTEAFLVIFGSLFPDLIDKPLAWIFGVLPGGRTLAHSILVVIPLCLLVYLATRRAGRARWGIAFGIGYLLHPPADAVTAIWSGQEPWYGFLIWPLWSPPETSESTVELGSIASEVLGTVTEPIFLVYLAGEVLLLGAAVLVWRADGYPGVRRWGGSLFEDSSPNAD